MKANSSSCLLYRHKKDERNQGYPWRHCLSERDFKSCGVYAEDLREEYCGYWWEPDRDEASLMNGKM